LWFVVYITGDEQVRVERGYHNYILSGFFFKGYFEYHMCGYYYYYYYYYYCNCGALFTNDNIINIDNAWNFYLIKSWKNKYLLLTLATMGTNFILFYFKCWIFIQFFQECGPIWGEGLERLSRNSGGWRSHVALPKFEILTEMWS
jgi:hypothetical protein